MTTRAISRATGRTTVQLTGDASMVLAQAATGGLEGLLLPLVFLALLYVLLIRPQSKRRKELAKLVASLGVGDLVATVGGVHGAVVELDGETVDLAVTEDAHGGPDVVMRFDRNAIARVIERAGSGESGAEADETDGDGDR